MVIFDKQERVGTLYKKAVAMGITFRVVNFKGPIEAYMIAADSIKSFEQRNKQPDDDEDFMPGARPVPIKGTTLEDIIEKIRRNRHWGMQRIYDFYDEKDDVQALILFGRHYKELRVIKQFSSKSGMAAS